MLHNEEFDYYEHKPVEEDDEPNGDGYAGVNCGNNNDRNIWHRKILTPLDMNILTNRSFSKTTHTSISHMMQDPKLIQNKKYIIIIILHLISNKC